jgi:hypothetical protein
MPVVALAHSVVVDAGQDEREEKCLYVLQARLLL